MNESRKIWHNATVFAKMQGRNNSGTWGQKYTSLFICILFAVLDKTVLLFWGWVGGTP